MKLPALLPFGVPGADPSATLERGVAGSLTFGVPGASVPGFELRGVCG